MAGPLAAAAMVGEVVSALAAVPQAVQNFVGSITGFVEAVDPSSVRQMNEALRSLSATIGYALAPVVQGFTQIVKEVAGELMGSFTDLREIVGSLVGQAMAVVRPIIGALSSVFREVVGTLQTMMPVIEVLTTYWEGLANVVGVVVRIAGTLQQAFYQMVFGSLGDLKGVIEVVQTAFVRLTLAIVGFTVSLLRVIGMTDLALKFLKGMEGTGDKGRPGAPQNVQLGDVMSVYKARLLEAAKAGSGPSLAEQTKSIMEQVRDEVIIMRKAIESQGENQMTLSDWLKVMGGFGATSEILSRTSLWGRRQEAGGGGG